MYYEELARLREEFEALPVHDDARLKQLCHELETVTRKALPNDADRYVSAIKHAFNAFYPRVFIGGAPDQTPRTWPQGKADMVGVIDSILHNIRLNDAEDKQPDRTPERDMRKIFIVHGHDHGMLRDVDAFVRRIGIEPVVLIDEPNRGRTVIEKFEQNANVPFAVVLFSPDDVGRAVADRPDSEKRRPRQNVVLELGFFIGTLGRPNVAVMVDDTEEVKWDSPSDYAGVVTIPYRPGSDWQMRLMRELKASDIIHDPSKA
jgi:predicted nucleotide-binding protein